MNDADDAGLFRTRRISPPESEEPSNQPVCKASRDEHALRADDDSLRRSDRAFTAAVVGAQTDHPDTPLESQLHRIWCILLNREFVSVTENFFAGGGD